MGVYAVGIPGTVIAVFNAPSMREANTMCTTKMA